MPQRDPHLWLVACDVVGVLLAGVIWRTQAAGSRARGLLRATGAVLLVLAVGSAIERMSGAWGAMGAKGFFTEEEGGRHAVMALLAVAGLAAGLAVSWYFAACAGDAAETGAGEEPEPAVEETSAPPAWSAWSRTEVLGDAPQAEPGELSPPCVAGPPAGGDATLRRRLAVVTAGLALPVANTTGYLAFVFFFGFSFGREKVVPSTVLLHLMTGLVAGGALLGALARDDDDPGVLMPSFGLLAAGTGLAAAFPDTFLNEYWFFAGASLAVGLLVPSAVSVLARVFSEERRHLATGAVAAALVLAVTAAAAGRGSSAREAPSFDEFGLPAPEAPAFRDVVPSPAS